MALLLLFPSCGQDNICTLRPYCDFRCFVLPCISSPEPYSPSSIQGKDACYPPIAYLAVKALAWDKGDGWMPSSGEARLALSLFVAQLIAVILLALRLRSRRWLAVIAVMLSPAVLSSMFRLNPSGWSFALICVFVCWYNSESAVRRVIAAVALGLATALKVVPCVCGVLYVAESPLRPRDWNWRGAISSAGIAAVLVFLPFVFFGGYDAIPSFFCNALANSQFYSIDDPIWGAVNIVNRFEESYAPSSLAVVAAWTTRILAGALVFASCFIKDWYRKLLFLGAAMAFLTHHDYGGAYLIPALFAWMGDVSSEPRNRVILMLESVAWFLIMTPLQIPCGDGGSMNAALQGESLFLLLCLALFAGAFRRRAEGMGLESVE